HLGKDDRSTALDFALENENLDLALYLTSHGVPMGEIYDPQDETIQTYLALLSSHSDTLSSKEKESFAFKMLDSLRAAGLDNTPTFNEFLKVAIQARRTELKKWVMEKDSLQKTCVSCLEEYEEITEPNTGPANCPCYFCYTCSVRLVDFAINQSGIEPAQCPQCKEPMGLTYLRRLQIPNERVDLFEKRTLENTLHRKVSGWFQCPVENCVNGMQVTSDSPTTFSCSLCTWQGCVKCGKPHINANCEEYAKDEAQLRKILELGALQAPEELIGGPPPETDVEDPLYVAYYQGRIRPCYYCGTATERTDGCNEMNCKNPRCGKQWHWNKGVYNERSADFSAGPRLYESLVSSF
ncbi:MAG: hypothetical protein ABIQ95_14870, partial [Bdellovibrionia bacterium]